MPIVIRKRLRDYGSLFDASPSQSVYRHVAATVLRMVQLQVMVVMWSNACVYSHPLYEVVASAMHRAGHTPGPKVNVEVDHDMSLHA